MQIASKILPSHDLGIKLTVESKLWTQTKLIVVIKILPNINETRKQSKKYLEFFWVYMTQLPDLYQFVGQNLRCGWTYPKRDLQDPTFYNLQ